MDPTNDIGLYSLKPAGWFGVFSYLSSAENIVSRLALWKVACIADERLKYQLATPKRGVLAIRWCTMPTDSYGELVTDYFEAGWEHQCVACLSLNSNTSWCMSCITCKRGIRQMTILVKESAKLQFDLIRRNLLRDGGDISTLILDMRLLRYFEESYVGNDDCPIKINVIQIARLVNDISAKHAASIQHLIYIEDNLGPGVHEHNRPFLPAQVHKLVRLDRMLATMSNLSVVYLPSMREYEAANSDRRSTRATHRSAWEALESLAPERRLASVQLIVMETSEERDLVLTQFGGTCTMPDLPSFNGMINVARRSFLPNDVVNTSFHRVASKIDAPVEMDSEIGRLFDEYITSLEDSESIQKELQHSLSNELKIMLADLWHRTTCVWQTVHGHPRFHKFNIFGSLQRILSSDTIVEGLQQVVAPFSSTGLSFLNACSDLRKRHVRYNDGANSRTPALWHGDFLVNLLGTESFARGASSPVSLCLHVRYDWQPFESEESIMRQVAECQKCLLAVLNQLVESASNARLRTISKSYAGEHADFCDLMCQNLTKVRFSFRGPTVKSARPYCLGMERRLLEKAAKINMRVMEEKGFIPLARLKKIKIGWWESVIPDSFVWF